MLYIIVMIVCIRECSYRTVGVVFIGWWVWSQLEASIYSVKFCEHGAVLLEGCFQEQPEERRRRRRRRRRWWWWWWWWRRKKEEVTGREDCYKRERGRKRGREGGTNHNTHSSPSKAGMYSTAKCTVICN